MLYLLNIYRNLCIQFFIRVRVGYGDRKRELSHTRFGRVRRVNGEEKEKREKRGKKRRRDCTKSVKKSRRSLSKYPKT